MYTNSHLYNVDKLWQQAATTAVEHCMGVLCSADNSESTAQHEIHSTQLEQVVDPIHVSHKYHLVDCLLLYIRTLHIHHRSPVLPPSPSTKVPLQKPRGNTILLYYCAHRNRLNRASFMLCIFSTGKGPVQVISIQVRFEHMC